MRRPVSDGMLERIESLAQTNYPTSDGAEAGQGCGHADRTDVPVDAETAEARVLC